VYVEHEQKVRELRGLALNNRWNSVFAELLAAVPAPLTIDQRRTRTSCLSFVGWSIYLSAERSCCRRPAHNWKMPLRTAVNEGERKKPE
jgi:hypothetical protein